MCRALERLSVAALQPELEELRVWLCYCFSLLTLDPLSPICLQLFAPGSVLEPSRQDPPTIDEDELAGCEGGGLLGKIPRWFTYISPSAPSHGHLDTQDQGCCYWVWHVLFHSRSCLSQCRTQGHSKPPGKSLWNDKMSKRQTLLKQLQGKNLKMYDIGETL